METTDRPTTGSATQVRSALADLAAAEQRLMAARAEATAARDALIDELASLTGKPASGLVIDQGWPCEDSPTSSCVYDDLLDPCLDSCLFCGDPQERK